MQPVEKIDRLFLTKLLLLSGLLYIGFVAKVPPFLKSAEARPLEQFASPEDEQHPKQIKKLYYRLVSDQEQEPEEIAI